ncbi:hypothetical protein WJX72_003291 [[Myrmecia] bisecta]|uniref:DUF6816 domain-containing protein n=1 Tax=[Myrmecia] bisecta TaxID=41462 RepID=A0AAW1PVH8_9CHLO
MRPKRQIRRSISQNCVHTAREAVEELDWSQQCREGLDGGPAQCSSSSIDNRETSPSNPESAADPCATVESCSHARVASDYTISRRGLLRFAGCAVFAAAGLATRSKAEASALPSVVDKAWQVMGGGPPDLFFPDQWLGVWRVESTLIKVETPLGPDFIPDLRVVERAKREDLNKPLRYEVAFIRNRQGKIITDRRFNTNKLLDVYMGAERAGHDNIKWDPNNPNSLSLLLPGGMNILTRVTRRSEDPVAADRLDTSEYFEQVFDTPGRAEPRVKASQCYTKYKWRDERQAAVDGGPAIVATQVISDYLTAYDGEMRLLQAQNKPVVVYTYRMTFRRDLSNGAIAI